MCTYPTPANHERTQRFVRGYHDAWVAGEVGAAAAYTSRDRSCATAQPAPALPLLHSSG